MSPGLRLSQMLILCLATTTIVLTVVEGRMWCQAVYNRQTQSALLVFHFNQNMGDMMHNYRISFCKQHEGGPKCQPILCNWVDTNQRVDLLCSTHGLFRDMTCQAVTDTLSCQVTNVNSDHAGHYSCDLVPPVDDQLSQPCLLWVPDEDHKGSINGWMMFGILIIVVIVIGGIIGVVVFLVRKRRKRNNQQPQGIEAADTLLTDPDPNTSCTSTTTTPSEPSQSNKDNPQACRVLSSSAPNIADKSIVILVYPQDAQPYHKSSPQIPPQVLPTSSTPIKGKEEIIHCDMDTATPQSPETMGSDHAKDSSSKNNFDPIPSTSSNTPQNRVHGSGTPGGDRKKHMNDVPDPVPVGKKKKKKKKKKRTTDV